MGNFLSESPSPSRSLENKEATPQNETPPTATSTKNAMALSENASSTVANIVLPNPKIKTPVIETSTKKQNPIETLISPAIKESGEKLQLSIKVPTENQIPLPTSSEVNELTRKAIVNILCYTENAGSLRPLTGSGIIIDERGVILTNAHLAQYFLLRDYPTKNNVDCLIRTGSPASATYRGELLFISPSWIEKNRKNIIETNPLGTGEHDFGLILITSMTDKNAMLPAVFPSLSINTEEMDEKEVLSHSYVVVGYPAGFLGGLTVVQNLFISSTISGVKQVFTFKQNTVDLLSLGGSILAQKGSSGGAVVRINDKKLVGIVVTTTEEDTTSERDLRAVTTSHINRSLEASTNQDIYSYLSGNLIEKVNQFHATRFPYLKSLLVEQLNSN